MKKSVQNFTCHDVEAEESKFLQLSGLDYISDLNQLIQSVDPPDGLVCPRCSCRLSILGTDTYCTNCQWNSIEYQAPQKERIMNYHYEKPQEKYYFGVSVAVLDKDGRPVNTERVGFATLMRGQKNYLVHLYMFPNEKFVLIPDSNNPAKYRISVPSEGKKTSWNNVGHAIAKADHSCIVLHFNILSKPLYMCIFPENSSRGAQ